MLLWFVGLAVLVVWEVFHDPALDYRLVVAGALAPDAIDAVFGGARLLHTLAFSVALLGAVMLATRGRRSARRRLLALPIGTFTHLVLDAMWTRTEGFWWPAFGWALEGGLPSSQRPLTVLVVQELAGAAAVAWCWRRFRLAEPERRRQLVRTGRLGRDLLGPRGTGRA